MKTKYNITLMALITFSFISTMHANTRVNVIPPDTISADSIWTTFDDDGSVQFSAETIRLMKDADYRQNKYPAQYNPDQIPGLLEKGEIAFAMWTLINAHVTSPDQSRTIAFMLARRGVPGEYYLNAFYTYAFADPAVFHFSETDGNYLEHPERLEEKLESCRALAAYTYKYQETNHMGN